MRQKSIAARLFATTLVGGLLFSLVGCEPVVIPDTRQTPPPLCSSTSGTVPITMSPDPIAPSSHTGDILKVVWQVNRRCATDIPANPADGPGGRRSAHCEITIYAHRQTESGGDCIHRTGGDPPAGWHVGRSTNVPAALGFEMVGEMQGNLCVLARVFLQDGRNFEVTRRTWLVQLDSGIRIPDAGHFMGIIGDVDPSFSPRSSSSDGCPNN